MNKTPFLLKSKKYEGARLWKVFKCINRRSQSFQEPTGRDFKMGVMRCVFGLGNKNTAEKRETASTAI